MILARILAWCTLFAPMVSSGQEAKSQSLLKGEILEFGRYNVVEAKSDVAVRSGSGKLLPSLHIAKTIEFIDHTNRVVARKGTSFGFRYRLTNVPTNEVLTLEVETSHPDFIWSDGKVDSGRTLRIHCEAKNGIWEHHVGYRFDDEFEMVEGEWKFTIYCGTQRLLSKSFRVTKQ